MIFWKHALIAISTELASLSLLTGSTSEAALLAYFSLHGVAAALSASLAWMLLPNHLRKPAWAVFTLLYSFGFFIPGLGVIATVVVFQVAMRFPKAVRPEHYTEIVEPQFVANEKEKRDQSDIRVGYARRILRDPKADVDTKLRVLIALQNLRPKVAVPLLQGLLADPSEDLRLLAYSMMDAWEKDITQRIQKAQIQLDAAVEKGEKNSTLNAHRRLAELYWEQVDTRLARGDLRIFALQKAKHHCEESLPLDAYVGGVWLLYAMVLIELSQPEGARRALMLAHKAGMPDASVLPHLARLAFDAGRYDEVRSWMRRTARDKHLPHSLRQVVRYWTGKSVDVQL